MLKAYNETDYFYFCPDFTKNESNRQELNYFFSEDQILSPFHPKLYPLKNIKPKSINSLSKQEIVKLLENQLRIARFKSKRFFRHFNFQ